MVDDLLIELRNISKAFGDVPVLQRVNFIIRNKWVLG
jgi:ABC-type sugar transport system ATPase subunit